MSDKVIVSKSEIINAIQRAKKGNVFQTELYEWIDKATPVGGEAVGYIDDTGFFTKNPYEYPHKDFKAVYTTPQPAPDTVPVEKFNKLVWALKHVKPSTRSVDPNAWDTIEKALAEAMNGGMI